MLGINAQTGQPLSGIDHLRQSIRDILTTRIGTRVMRRDYGSRLPALVDNPMTPKLAMELYSATAEATPNIPMGTNEACRWGGNWAMGKSRRWQDGTVDGETPPRLCRDGVRGLVLPPVSWGQGAGQFNCA